MAAHQLFGNTECTAVFKNTVDTATTHGDRIKARKSQQDPKYQTVLQIFKRTHNTNHCSSGVHYTSFGTEQRPPRAGSSLPCGCSCRSAPGHLLDPAARCGMFLARPMGRGCGNLCLSTRGSSVGRLQGWSVEMQVPYFLGHWIDPKFDKMN